MKKVIFLEIIGICIFYLTACSRAAKNEEAMQSAISNDTFITEFIVELEQGPVADNTFTLPLGEEAIQEPKSEDFVWYSYEEVMYNPEDADNLIFRHDFMESRDGQGYHMWAYGEITDILVDYGERVGYDFTLDKWTAERIYPLSGGYYEAVVAQNGEKVSMDLLFHPDKRKYVILYAQYEGGDRSAGVNKIPYASQLEWQHFDFHGDYGTISVENPYEDLCETSVSSVLYISLYRYGQETGYEGTWSVRELFGRSPFFDYLVEAESGFVWVCVDIGRHCYTYVDFE